MGMPGEKVKKYQEKVRHIARRQQKQNTEQMIKRLNTRPSEVLETTIESGM